ncbi:MAG: NAD(P)-dependent oxidoreductase [Acidimicrobiia bacterium]
MRILIADQLAPRAIANLRSLGHTCDVRSHLSADQLPHEVTGYEALVVRSTEVTSGTIDASDRLNLIIRAGAGTDTIDTAAAAEAGIYVCNVPGTNSIAVAELTLGLVLALDRSIPDNVVELRAGRWNKRRFSQSKGLYGRRIGIVGLGEIGLAVAERAAAFGLEVYALKKADRAPQTLERCAAIPVSFVPDLEALASTCDILTFHVPATNETRGIIGADLLAHIQPGASIINTSRGELVDEQALVEAMDTKGIRCGLDVYEDEPAAGEARFESALAGHPNVYGTHHIGASTAQAQDATAAEVIRIVELFEQGTVLHGVNVEAATRARRHRAGHPGRGQAPDFRR